MNGPSPCKSHKTPLVGSPPIGVPLQVSDDTSMWVTTKHNRVKIAKGRTCYLADYDACTKVGVIFLCTASGFAGVNANRFIPVYGGVVGSDGRPILEPPNPMLHVVPPDAFSAPFYLNISHPLGVRIVHVMSGSFYVLRSSVLPIPPPPAVGMQGFMLDPTSNSPRLVRLHPDSELEFWQFHRRYHKDRPTIGAATIGGVVGAFGAGGSSGKAFGGGRALGGGVWRAFGVGGSSGGALGGGVGAFGAGGSSGKAFGGGGALGGGVWRAFGVGGSSGGALGGGVGAFGAGSGASGGGVAATDGTQYLLPNGEWERGVAPWGRIGQFRIGFDIPLVLDTPSFDFDSDDEDDLPAYDIVARVLCLGDLDWPSIEEAKGSDLEKVWLDTSRGAFLIY